MCVLTAGMLCGQTVPAYAADASSGNTGTEAPQTSETPAVPSAEPSLEPTDVPTPEPTAAPTAAPEETPAVTPTAAPTPESVSSGSESTSSSTSEADSRDQEEKPEDSGDTGDTRESGENITPVVDPSAGNVYVNETENEKEVYRYLVGSLGLNRAAAAGLMGNFWHECGFNQAAVGGGGISYGLAQWTGSNFLLMKGWCDSNGQDYRTVKGQMAFLKYDLETRFQGCYAYLKSVPETADGAYAAAVYFCTDYERPLYTAQQAVIRGNTTRATYWPRYQNAATDGLLDPIEDYMEWLEDYVADDSHGYSSVSFTNNPDVNECSLIWYALYENGYLIGENENRPFGFDSMAEVLEKHGFEEQPDTEADLSKLQYGDIIVNADSSGASVYLRNGRMYLAQQTDANKNSGEKPGDQGKEVFLGTMEKGVERKVYRLKEKDSLPAYAVKALEDLPRQDYLAVNSISKVADGQTDSYSFLTEMLRGAEMLSGEESVTSGTEEAVLEQKGFQNVSAQILEKTDSIKKGDIVRDIRYGTGIALGNNYYILVEKESDGSRIVVKGMADSSWRKVLRKNTQA